MILPQYIQTVLGLQYSTGLFSVIIGRWFLVSMVIIILWDMAIFLVKKNPAENIYIT